MSDRGVEDCTAAAADEASERPLHLKEGLLWTIELSWSTTLMGVGIWLPKVASTRKLLRGEESLDPVDHGNVG